MRLDGIAKPGLRQAHEVDKKNQLATGKFSEKNLNYLSLNLLVQEVFGLLLSPILFRIKITS